MSVLGTEHPPAPAAEAVRHVHLLPTLAFSAREHRIVYIVEGLNYKRPIQCLASSKIWTPTPSPRRVCTPPPPPVGGGGPPPPGGRGGGGCNSLEDARHCSVFYICKYFVLYIQRESKKSKDQVVFVSLIFKGGWFM